MILPEHLQRKETETLDDYHIRLFENKENYEIDNYTIANLLNKEAGTDYGESKWRKDYAAYKRWENYFNSKKGVVEPDDTNYKSTVEINADGSQKSDKLLRMSEENSKDPEFLLKAHGYDPNEWEIVSSKSSIWNQHNKQDGTLTLYSSKITARPLTNKFNIDDVIAKLEKVKPKKLNISKKPNTAREGLLEIPLFDQHFGISTYEDYLETQERIGQKIAKKQWDEVLFVIGQDLLHNDGFTSQTTKGTVI